MPDVLIIGGGPSGSILGSYLSMHGISNVIVEKSIHPRPHVGESLVPSTTRVFTEIGFLPKMEQAGFVRKYGAAWHPTRTVGEFAIEFAEFPQPGVNQDYTYHVDRARFDSLLLKHAEELGSKVICGVPVKKVIFEDGFARGALCSVGGQEVELEARIVVDATGRDTLLGRQLRIKRKDELFNQFVVHAWYTGVNRGQGVTEDFIHIYFLPIERGWVWQIPITDTVTSVGVVAEREVFRSSKRDLANYFDRHVRSTPDIERAMKDARRINEFKQEGDYSYAMDRFAGDGYVLVGDAARFVDPIFSSGVSVASHSAKFASDAVRTALDRGDYSASMFEEYETTLRRGVSVWYEFICLYYKLAHQFTYFIAKEKFRHQVLQLLQGDVYNRENVEVLDEMRKFVGESECSEDSLLKAHVTDIPV